MTRTVSRLSGTLEVLRVGTGVSDFTETAPVFLGGRIAPVCRETGTLEVCFGAGMCEVFGGSAAAVGGFTTGGATTGGRTGSFISGTLAVCFEGIGAAACFISGTLAVCFDGGIELGFISGTLAVCFDGSTELVCFISGTLAVCFEGGTEPVCFINGTLDVNFEGAAGGCLIRGTLAVCLDGGASAGFWGVNEV